MSMTKNEAFDFTKNAMIIATRLAEYSAPHSTTVMMIREA